MRLLPLSLAVAAAPSLVLAAPGKPVVRDVPAPVIVHVAWTAVSPPLSRPLKQPRVSGQATQNSPSRPMEARAGALGLVIELRSDFGFQELSKIEFTTGRTASMDLNEGISAAAGVSFLPLLEGRLATRLTGGYKVQYLRASNGNALFTGIPLELMEVLYTGSLRFGLGGSLLVSPRIRGEGFLEGQTRRYDAAPGVMADAEWLVSTRSRTGVGLRGSWSRFSADGLTRDGPAIGVVVRTDLELIGR